jgi:hypothetical protein
MIIAGCSVVLDSVYYLQGSFVLGIDAIISFVIRINLAIRLPVIGETTPNVIVSFCAHKVSGSSTSRRSFDRRGKSISSRILQLGLMGTDDSRVREG